MDKRFVLDMTMSWPNQSLEPTPDGHSFAVDIVVPDWKIDLQTDGARGKSRKVPRRSWARNHMGNPNLNVVKLPLIPREYANTLSLP
jgi:hypothetical protein